MKLIELIVMVFASSLLVTSANAAVCDYRPSAMLSGGGATAVGAGGAGAATAGAAMNVAGFYTLTHSVTGLTMRGSPAAGASAAGTVGIIGGTGGVIGTVGAIVMAPATIIGGIIVSVGVGAYEGACFFQDERITEYDQIEMRMRSLGERADPAFFRFVDAPAEGLSSRIIVRDEDGAFQEYLIANLYIVNGTLKHRDWFMNTVIGDLTFIVPAANAIEAEGAE